MYFQILLFNDVVINVTAICELTEFYKLKLQAVDQATIKCWNLLAKGHST